MKLNKAKFTVKKIMCDGVGFMQVKPNVWKLYDGIRLRSALTCDTKAVLKDFVMYNKPPMVLFKFWVPANGWAADGYENERLVSCAVLAKAVVQGWNTMRISLGQEPIKLLSIWAMTAHDLWEY